MYYTFFQLLYGSCANFSKWHWQCVLLSSVGMYASDNRGKTIACEGNLIYVSGSEQLEGSAPSS